MANGGLRGQGEEGTAWYRGGVAGGGGGGRGLVGGRRAGVWGGEGWSPEWGERRPPPPSRLAPLLPLPNPCTPPQPLERSPGSDGLSDRDPVRIFQIPAHRQAAGDAAERHATGRELLLDVERRRLA